MLARARVSPQREREREREEAGGGDESLFFSACLPLSALLPPAVAAGAVSCTSTIDGSLIFARGRRAFAVFARSASSAVNPRGEKGFVVVSQGPPNLAG